MAFRSQCNSLMKNGLKGKAMYATTASSPNLKKAYAVADDKVSKTVKKYGDFFPVYVSLGLVLTSLGLGAHIASQQLLYSPTVHVRKSRRETLPDVYDPDTLLKESEKFIKKSFFRKVAHVQEFNKDPAISDPTRGDILARPVKAETLKTVGLDPKQLLPKQHAAPAH